MEWLFGLAVIGLMLLLRLAVPITILALLVAVLHRLEDRWETTT